MALTPPHYYNDYREKERPTYWKMFDGLEASSEWSKTFDAEALSEGTMKFSDAWEILTSAWARDWLEAIEDASVDGERIAGREVARNMALTIVRTHLARTSREIMLTVTPTPSEIITLYAKVSQPELDELSAFSMRIQHATVEELRQNATAIVNTWYPPLH